MFIAATRGDRLELTNETDYPFLPWLRPTDSRQPALLHNQTRTIELDQAGAFSAECGFAAACGRMDVIVAYDSVHAVTGEGGRFRITNVPAGRRVEFNAWHPLFHWGVATVDIVAGQTHHIELTIAPPTSSANGGPDPP
jgi:hypothetical protein